MNDDIIRSIEERGGECTLAHIVEWVFYTNLEHQRRLRQQGRRFSKAMLVAKISNYIQHRDEHRLSRIFDERPPRLRGAAGRDGAPLLGAVPARHPGRSAR